MPTLIMTKLEGNIDGSIKAKAMSFLLKLGEDDTTPGLHVEPIKGSADPRVRTGRVDQGWRAVLFRIDNNGETHYVVHGVWPHDKANKIAQNVKLRLNPVNGLPQFEETSTPDPTPIPVPAAPMAEQPPQEPVLVQWGRTKGDLVDRLGIPEDVAEQALAAPDDDALLELAGEHEGWLGLILVDLASGDSVKAIIDKHQLAKPTSTDTDADLIDSLHHPAARAQFAIIDGQDELRRVLEEGDFGAWRIFLHPEQRKYVDKGYNGSFRLSGGAGTGKTVVLVHRARRLAAADAGARVVLTTFTTNLAQALRDQLRQLDPTLQIATALGGVGVHVAGIDALAFAVIKAAGSLIDDAVTAVLGEARSSVKSRTPVGRWRTVIESSSTTLPQEIANETFLTSEYALVVLPNRVTSQDDYLRVRRPGRGLALDRAKRQAVWALIDSYRAQGRIDGSLDFTEAAAVAAAHLEAHHSARPADHVLVDEAQDLTPPQLQLVRALAAPGPDDVFLAEDSHQRIYGPRVVLGRYGIKVVGRSQRMTLNYRTTAQNLRYAMSVLEGGEYVDLEEAPESTGYRSARTGPVPQITDTPGLDSELDVIVQQTQKWLGQETPAGTIAVLVQDQYQRDRVAKRLTEASVPARSVDNETPPDDRVLVMTMHRAKGMEFGKVILADSGYVSPAQKARLDAMDPSERADAELRQRSLEYVAATRARDELVVLRRP